MTDMLDANTEQFANIEEVIRDLWELKKLFDRHSAEHVKPLNFDHLLRQQSYRDKVLERLSAVRHSEIAALARKLKAQNLSGSVHIDDVRAEAELPKEQPAFSAEAQEQYMAIARENAEILQVQQKLKTSRRHWQMASSVLGVCLLGSLILQLYPFVSDLLGGRTIEVGGSITEDTYFSADNTYILTAPVFVEDHAKLTIEAGTTVYGRQGSALIVTRDAQLIAKGTQEAPIVFTSIKPVGERNRGDWGGLVLLGNAPVNRPGQIEGIDKNDPRGIFGGKDANANCGILEFVRVEFAGFETFVDNELNGLTLGGCGSDTIVRNVQVHKSLDDGIEIFGGTVDLKNILITGAGDDAFDWDMGWQGRVQFLVVQMHGDDGDNAFEGDNAKGAHDLEPRSRPSFYNVTLIGANSKQMAHRGMNIRHGSAGEFGNILMVGFSKEAIDLRDEGVSRMVADGELKFSNLMFYQINDGEYFADESGDKDDDGGFDEADYFSRHVENARFGLDPRLPATIYNSFNPDFTPMSHSPARDSQAVIPQGEFWDEGAQFIGAVRPGSASSWLSGWTAFPSS